MPVRQIAGMHHGLAGWFRFSRGLLPLFDKIRKGLRAYGARRQAQRSRTAQDPDGDGRVVHRPFPGGNPGSARHLRPNINCHCHRMVVLITELGGSIWARTLKAFLPTRSGSGPGRGDRDGEIKCFYGQSPTRLPSMVVCIVMSPSGWSMTVSSVPAKRSPE